MASEKSSKKGQLAQKAVSIKKSSDKSNARVADSDLENESEAEQQSESTSSSGTSEDESSSSESESGSDVEMTDAPVRIEKRKSQVEQATTSSTPAKKTNTTKPPPPFVPPPGFEPLKPVSRPKAAEIFSPANLAGKQIWYITAPSTVPISSIKSVNLSAVAAGKPAMEIDGNEYGFVKDERTDAHTRLVVPTKAGTYVTSQRPVDSILHLQYVARLPAVDGEQATIPVSKKPVRPQPKGLRMRFKPSGFGEGDAGVIGEESDDEMEEEAQPVFKKHKSSKDSEKEKKKKDKDHRKDKKDKKEKKEKRKSTA